jgi:hypothetical protein
MTFDSHLKLKIYDKDVLKDDFMGFTKINLDELLRFDGKGVQYFPVYKKSTLGSTSGGSIGQIGIAVKFNCTEIPQGRADLKTQAQETMTRKDQVPMGVQDTYQQGHPTHMGGPQGSVPSTYQGPVQHIIPPTGQATTSDEIVTHHKPGLIGAGLGALGTGAVLGSAMRGSGTSGTTGTTGTGMTGTGTGITGTGTGMTGTGMTGTGMTGTGMTSTGLAGTGTTFNGSIDITLSDAKLFVVQHGSRQDPYCVVALGSTGLKSMMEGQGIGKEKFQTKVHNGAGQHPIWNETHSLSLQNMKLDSWLQVRVYDRDVVKDDYIGKLKLSLGEMLKFDKRGVNYFPLWKKGALGQTKTEQIGEVGLGVVFNCTEMPQAQADFKSQATDSMARKQQQLGVGQQGMTQQGMTQQVPIGSTTGSTATVNQPLNTKPVYTQGITQGTQGTQGISYPQTQTYSH